jgi:hypothetical protein
MRLLIVGVFLALLAPAASSSVADAPRLLGPICHADAEPRIAGPHRLVMLAGMGNDHLAADTQSAEAQRWFDYGLTLARSFEHGDAVLAFQRAEAADPICSLCVWGEAWASGPNINFGPPPSETPRLLALAQRAQSLAAPDAAGPIRPLETALVDRYGADGARRYAHDLDAMQRAHPDDIETAIFDAEAWLILENDEDDPSGPTRAVEVLRPLLPAHADSSGLVHFFVHATEDAGEPELAAPYAARLAQLAPSASHMVHMPSHTWFRVGRYEDAALANVAALKADRAYAEKTDFPTPLGGLTYHFHDIRFGLAAAMMSGDGRIALNLVGQFNRDFPAPAAFDARTQIAAGDVYAAMGRFASPSVVLAAPDAAPANPFLAAMRHYARGEANLRLGHTADARAEAALIAPLSAAANAPAASRNAAVAEIARLSLEGDADLLAHNSDAAIDAFGRAAKLQDQRFARSYDPPAWWCPVRRGLAAALLAKGDAAGAKRETSAVLQTWKLDPVALAIQARAERALRQPDAQRDAASARAGWRGDPRRLTEPLPV